MRVLILDNYDSFTYNLVHLVEQFTDDFTVIRNDEVSLDQIGEYEKILLSPGPGLPSEAGIMPDLIGRWCENRSILGICLGMQGIVEHFGGKLHNLKRVKHGVAEEMSVTDSQEPLFANVPSRFLAGRYHSWAVKENDLPPGLIATAVDDSNLVMAIRHAKYDLKGVQFHPESIMTPFGKEIVENWLQG